jgi:hypothetical protein
MTNITIAKIFLFILVGFIATLTACEKEEPRLSRSHNRLIDSLSQEKKIGLREELDSLCDIQFAQEITRKTDSIV